MVWITVKAHVYCQPRCDGSAETKCFRINIKLFKRKTYFKWMVLYIRIPSAIPQMWIISSLDMRSKSAPVKWVKVEICWPNRWWFIHLVNWLGVESLTMFGVCKKDILCIRNGTIGSFVRKILHIHQLQPVAVTKRCGRSLNSNWTTTHYWYRLDYSNSYWTLYSRICSPPVPVNAPWAVKYFQTVRSH